MAVDAFLKIEGIDGESTDLQHKDAIEISSFSFGVSNPTTISSATGGAGAGKAQFQDFHFTSSMTKASPKLMLSCATGTHIKKAELFCRKAGGNERAPVEFLKITLTDVLVSSYQTGGSNDIIPTDQFSLNYAKIEFDYTPQKSDGSLDSAVTASWDLKANKKA
jgi:type VI secretion system secreted protein Hcp